jgi:Flp pilus assembly protein TadB
MDGIEGTGPEPTRRAEASTANESEPSERRAIWMRGAFMLLFIAIYAVAEAVVAAVAVIQFGWLVFTEERNSRLESFGGSLSRFIYQIVRFWTFGSDQKPFPFSDWPRPPDGGAPW